MFMTFYNVDMEKAKNINDLLEYFDVAGRKPRWYDKKEIEYYLMYT